MEAIRFLLYRWIRQWFYGELQQITQVSTRQGYETKELRDSLGLKKTKRKLTGVFEAHCVDSWVLANGWTGGQASSSLSRSFAV